jgi:hypothetical protein
MMLPKQLPFCKCRSWCGRKVEQSQSDRSGDILVLDAILVEWGEALCLTTVKEYAGMPDGFSSRSSANSCIAALKSEWRLVVSSAATSFRSFAEVGMPQD